MLPGEAKVPELCCSEILTDTVPDTIFAAPKKPVCRVSRIPCSDNSMPHSADSSSSNLQRDA